MIQKNSQNNGNTFMLKSFFNPLIKTFMMTLKQIYLNGRTSMGKELMNFLCKI